MGEDKDAVPGPRAVEQSQESSYQTLQGDQKTRQQGDRDLYL